MSQQVFFAHANGFPSGTYGKLFAALAPEFEVAHLQQHAHDPRFPVDDNWRSLVDELIHHLQQQAQPVWGVGHSLGGVLHLHAALRCPELYRGVVMLDSPVLTRADQWVIRAAKRLGFIDRLTPAGRTLGRREEFADIEPPAVTSPARRCSGPSIPTAWMLTCSTACSRWGIACACVLTRPRKSASTAACLIPARAVRASSRYRWRWCADSRAGW